MRLFVARLAAGRLEVDGEGYHHLARVLRARRGDRVVLFDGAGVEADATVEDVGESTLALAVGAPRPAAVAGAPLTLLLGLLKGEKMDLVVQKATELGVARLVPLASAHAVVRLEDDARREARRARWQRIAREAARQSGRADVPEIAAVVEPRAAFAAAPPEALRLLFHERGAPPLRQLLGDRRPAAVVAAVGPEGGFAPVEVEEARAAGFLPCGLGPRILRAETAAIAALAVLAYAVDR
jgi:16S rRNA (uracil1498-N3)-methyltransferase